MKCVKRYFLSIFMLQTCSLFSMQFKDFDPTISFNGTTNNSMCSLQKFTGSIHSNKYNYMDYVHDVIAENIEKQNSKFKKLCDRIDEQHLALDKNAWFKGVRGAYTSFFKSSYLTNDQAADEMEQIESYIVEDDKEPVLEKLEQNHFYVNSLLRTLIFNKIQEIKHVKGSTIDVVYQPVIQKGFRKMVQERALHKYFSDAGIYKQLDHIPIKFENDIHLILLEHTQDLRPHLDISCDSNYLVGMDYNYHVVTWNLEEGVKEDWPDNPCDIEPAGCIMEVRTYSHGGCVGKKYWTQDKDDNYLATFVGTGVALREDYALTYLLNLFYISDTCKLIKNKPAILLFKRPQEISYLAQQAFYNSNWNIKELSALSNSKTIKDIKGFPRKNLKQEIDRQIRLLLDIV